MLVAMVVLVAATVLVSMAAAAERPTWVVGRDPALVNEVCHTLTARRARPATERFPSNSAQQLADYQLGVTRSEEAVAFYRQGRIDQAWGAIAEAVAAFERSFAVADDFEGIARAYLFRADLAMARGDNGKAEDDFMAAARLAPGLKLDPAATSPTVIEGFNTALELLKNSPTGGLSVLSKPAGATVLADGAVRGVTPLSVVLTAGPHLAVVRLRGYDVWATQVPVEANDVRKLEMFLNEASPIDLAAVEGTAESLRRLSSLDLAADWLVATRDGSGLRFGYLPAGADPVLGGPIALAALPAELAAVDDRLERGALAAVPAWAWYAAGIGGGALLLTAGVGSAVYLLWPQTPPPHYLSVLSK